MKDIQLHSGSGTLRATETGNGQPLVVLLHGWSCRRSDWDETLAELGGAHHLLAVDLPGHGESADSELPEWTVSALARVLAEAMRQRDPGRLVLVGHSMGGAVALEAARLLDGLDSVILVDTFVIPYGDLAEEQALEIEAPFHEDFAAAVDALVEHNTASVLSDEKKAWIKQRMAEGDVERLLPLWHDLLRWSPDRAFAELNERGLPVHAVNGDLVPEVARQRCRAHVREWPLDGAGHFPQFEMPERFHAMLAKVLEHS